MGTEPRYTDEEFDRRADAVYATIKDQVEPGNLGKFLSIDVDTGAYEIDENGQSALARLVTRLPDPQIFTFRIGYDAVLSYCGSLQRTAS